MRSGAGPTTKALPMSILEWLIVGVAVGYAASKLANKSSKGLTLDLTFGVFGAMVGGYLYSLFGSAPITRLYTHGLTVVAIDAVLVVFIYHAVTDRRSVH
jgi:uncharacterized membrane protein YeaQ/YmgE (transglycosylase-associated protein family)